jgi:hypothetical protein
MASNMLVSWTVVGNGRAAVTASCPHDRQADVTKNTWLCHKTDIKRNGMSRGPLRHQKKSPQRLLRAFLGCSRGWREAAWEAP